MPSPTTRNRDFSYADLASCETALRRSDERRKCTNATCITVLSPYNLGDYCGACTSKHIIVSLRMPQGEETRTEDADTLTVDKIIRASAQVGEIKVERILSPLKTDEIARARQVSMYLANRLLNKSYPQLGRRFKRDHTTVMHSVHRVEALRKEEDQQTLCLLNGICTLLAIEIPPPRTPQKLPPS